MSRRRFFASRLTGDTAVVAGSHLARVLRAQAGQTYELAWQGRVYLATISAVTREEVQFALGQELPQPPLAPSRDLAAALSKFDRFEWMLEKATELGVHRVHLLATRRTDSHLLAAAAKRIQRWRAIAQEAAEQSRRADFPEILAPQTLIEFLGQAPPGILLSEDPAAPPFLPASGPALLLTGPEGGWAPEEFDQIAAAGHRPASLGPRILRCETAILAALARCP